MPLVILPDASDAASAILMPSGRTNGIEPIDMSNREAADAVEVESRAKKVVALARPALVASDWQSESALEIPVDGSKLPVDTNATRPATGV